MFGGHVRAVFTLVLFIYVVCVVVTITSFREIPLDRLYAANAMFATKVGGRGGGGGMGVVLHI